MKLDVTKNTSRNMAFGMVFQMVQMLARFVIRTAVIYYLGIEYAGVNGLFSSVMQILNLAELNVGEAIVVSMYRPLAEGDKGKINGLLDLYSRYYFKIGVAVLATGICLLPFVDRLVSGGIPAGISLQTVYLLQLLATATSYFIYGYESSLLVLHQRNDIKYRINIVVTALQCISQLAAVAVFHSLYLYLVCSLVMQIATNLFIHVSVRKTYPEYRKENTLQKKEIANVSVMVKDAFMSKFGGVVVNSADTIIISMTMGLAVLGRYQNYYTLMKMVYAVPALLLSSVSAGLGNRFVHSDAKAKLDDFQNMTFLFCCIAGFCIPCFLCLYQPFVRMWVGAENVLGYGVVVLITVEFLMLLLMALGGRFEYAAGRFHQDRYRPLVEGITNLAMNILMVRWIGLYGILLSTILSMLLLSYPWLLYNLFTNVFCCNAWGYCRKLAGYLCLTGIISFVCVSASGRCPEDGLIALFTRGAVCTVVSTGVLYLVYHNTAEFRWMEGIASRTVCEWKSRRKTI